MSQERTWEEKALKLPAGTGHLSQQDQGRVVVCGSTQDGSGIPVVRTGGSLLQQNIL